MKEVMDTFFSKENAGHEIHNSGVHDNSFSGSSHSCFFTEDIKFYSLCSFFSRVLGKTKGRIQEKNKVLG